MLEIRANLNKETEKIIDVVVNILKKYSIKNAWLFGSSLEKPIGKCNDIDIIIDPPENFSLFDMSRLALEIEDAIGKPVDIVTRRSLNPLISDKIRSVRIL